MVTVIKSKILFSSRCFIFIALTVPARIKEISIDKQVTFERSSNFCWASSTVSSQRYCKKNSECSLRQSSKFSYYECVWKSGPSFLNGNKHEFYPTQCFSNVFMTSYSITRSEHSLLKNNGCEMHPSLTSIPFLLMPNPLGTISLMWPYGQWRSRVSTIKGRKSHWFVANPMLPREYFGQ